MQRKDYFGNVEGLNLTDSPLYVKDGQATGGYNYDYVRTGGITKIRGASKINSIADAQLRTLGLGVHDTSTGAKTIIRAAGTKIQTLDIDTPLFTNVVEDTLAAGSDFFTSGTTQQVVNANFNTSTNNLLWLAGGGLTLPYAYNGTTATKNGVDAPTGTFTAVNQGSGTGGAWGAATGVYYYALVLRKTSTQALSNAALDQTITIATATDSVLLTFPTGVDATKYDKWYIYRSSVGGVTSFTAGSLVAQVTVGTATYTDLGVTLASSQVVPRAGNLSLDNSVLPSNTYKYLTTFKRRLVAAADNTVYISDLDKPESWPTGLRITIPTGGTITGLSVIGYNSPNTGTTDEYLTVFKERETWVITGTVALDTATSLYDIELKFVDSVGCISQSLVIRANGFVAWIDYRGVYLWNGLGKPVYTSRPIESLFLQDGDLDKTKLSLGWGFFLRSKNQLIWTLSHRIKGENSIRLKLDLRLTAPLVQSSGLTSNNVVEGVFNMDSTETKMYAGVSYLPSSGDEVGITGDASGFVYRLYCGVNDNGSGIAFNYLTKAFDQGLPTVAKQYSKVVVYIDESPPKDLTLKYWANYRTLEAEMSQIDTTMDSGRALSASLWDLAVWDVALWDEYNISIIPIVFNLSSPENNNQGDSIQLSFEQLEASAPVTIHGFSIYWDEVGVRK